MLCTYYCTCNTLTNIAVWSNIILCREITLVKVFNNYDGQHSTANCLLFSMCQLHVHVANSCYCWQFWLRKWGNRGIALICHYQENAALLLFSSKVRSKFSIPELLIGLLNRNMSLFFVIIFPIYGKVIT